MTADQDFLEFVVKTLVDNPDAVKVERVVDEMGVLLTLDVDPQDMGTMYNVACLHCLLGHKKHACVWLGKAIDAGDNDVNHMLSDDDLASIRDTERFRRLIERARSRASGSSGSGETTGSGSSNRGK